jgi:SAM-dependent methyltransferase
MGQDAGMSQTLADFSAERADFDRVLGGVRAILSAPKEALLSLDWLGGMIREVGLVPIPDAGTTYEGEEDYINGTQQGLIQLPREFARWLLMLAEHRPATYLEIGCFNGATASLAAAYLSRLVQGARVVTCDIFPAFLFYSLVNDFVPFEYHVGKTSCDFAKESFEAVFIDGDHSFEWSWADYQNVGRRARLCALHDVNNAPYRDLHLGGVCGVWELIREAEAGPDIEFHEFFEHPSREIMGIGVRVRRAAGPDAG